MKNNSNDLFLEAMGWKLESEELRNTGSIVVMPPNRKEFAELHFGVSCPRCGSHKLDMRGKAYRSGTIRKLRTIWYICRKCDKIFCKDK